MRRAAKGPALRRVSLAWPALPWVVTSDEDAYEIELRANVETPDGVATIDVWQFEGGWGCAPSVVLDVGGGTTVVMRPHLKPQPTLAEAIFILRPKIRGLAAYMLSSSGSDGFDAFAKSFTTDAAPAPISVSEQLRVARAALLHLATHGVP